MNIEALQRGIGATPDGNFGPASYTALFQKCGATLDRAQELAISANVHFPAFGIMDSTLRLAHFLAQLIHESGAFRYMEEIASGQSYEGRADLGNTQPGDGRLFKGRGPIQITGRANYRRYGRKLGIDLERHPELAALPSIGLLIALEFWRTNGLNTLADADDCRAITKLINGGLNGLDARCANLATIKAWLA